MKEFLSILKDYGGIFTFVVGYLLGWRSRKIADLSIWKIHRDELKKFFEESIDILSDIENLCEANPEILGQEFWNKRSSAITKLSSLRDKGKIIIPNLHQDKYGKEKLEAYQGVRERALDCIVAGYYCAIAINFKNFGYNIKPIELCTHNLESIPQARNIYRALKKLPGDNKVDGPNHRLEEKPEQLGWSCKEIIICCKRELVSEAQNLLMTRRWEKAIRTFLPENKKT